MTYERALESFEEAATLVDRKKNPELWLLLRGLQNFCRAARMDLDELKRRHEVTQQNVARVNADVDAAQIRFDDYLKGLE